MIRTLEALKLRLYGGNGTKLNKVLYAGLTALLLCGVGRRFKAENRRFSCKPSETS